MSPRSEKECAKAIHLRYKNASCYEKTIILNEFCTEYFPCQKAKSYQIKNQTKGEGGDWANRGFGLHTAEMIFRPCLEQVKLRYSHDPG
jgi:hypothetical protein